jgi:broad specificity phosphatase PhoE
MSARVPVLMIRHGETQWNTDGRIQGSSDVPLSDLGRADVARWRLPERFAGFRWMASTLVRARDTARLLGAPHNELVLDDRICEMHWGRWEGLTLDDLSPGLDEIRKQRAREGLDFRAPDGESNRDLQARIAAWLADVARDGAPTIAVAHKGVVRAMVSLATGSEMRGPMDKDLDWQAAHLFETDASGALSIVELDIPLTGGPR